MKKALSIVLLLLVGIIALSSFTIIDDLGRPVKIDQDIKRIISAAPAVSDYLKHLNAEDLVVGVTDWDNNIEAEKIGNMTPLNLEKIISLNPDIVFISGGFQEKELERLEKYNIKTIVINPLSINDIIRDTVLIGTIIDKKEQAIKLSKNLRERMLNISKETSTWSEKPTVMYAMISSQNISSIWTSGTGSFMNELLSIAGSLNVASPYTGNNGWLSVGPEFIVSKNPDIIIVPSYFMGDNSGIETLKSASQFKNVNAVKNNKIFSINNDKASQASPSLIEALESIYEIIKESK
ncbi:ABC transporter substrate-binding protein [Oceanotoga sp. DSM 15011]|uniref:Iron complex transport system substrate-binding protein n=1 Tax=Oceanotoga teriensis TaxID=515440 RepID=A0AA45C8J4_9BACT|nr:MULTISPECIES: ABC transporter substrate-binding protein [Oceanotoga]PWJ96188.1 iron complex transport system substrate-binding protein [Oceanotoga teriensis]UYO99971.1 ABC transporter substrate-binding protein [Oceanotoga sp. DSM 15011]